MTSLLRASSIGVCSRMVPAILASVLLSSPVRALQQVPHADSLLRTQFTADNGLPGAVIDEITQTRDGFLWVIDGSANLDRFDGTHFHQFGDVRPKSMAVAPDGDLWVATADDVIRIPRSEFTRFSFSGLTHFRPGRGVGDIMRLRWSRSGEIGRAHV